MSSGVAASARRFAVCALTCVLAACSGGTQGRPTTISVIGAENMYAEVIKEIGGPYVTVTSILDNPNSDPHAYESSTADASAVGKADLIVQNGMGYDAFMEKLEDASPHAGRTVIDVGERLGFKSDDNPHVWYQPQTMPTLAGVITAELSRRDPAHAAVFEANREKFITSLKPWVTQIDALRHAFPAAPVAVTEPVFNYTADAIGLDVRTRNAFQLAVEEGNDPAPQDVAAMRTLLTTHAVRLFIYNQQTVEPTTQELLDLAHRSHIPVVGVYETMPAGYTYARWMTAETDAIGLALRRHRSTERLR
ncbi:MAG TPA: zinc ABC transporter substrate-binding protein [Candidatus Limnocylindria bacterium]|jgi:zinc/manganese transport system substrate-binding protein|nr:zinc ABC transporter substrate-binding protein [Candidatus Limnocylindria bacterium]